VLSITCRRLKDAGYDVIEAADGEEAWNRILDSSPDIIILDVNMPKKDGFSVLRDLRANPPHGKWQPVIIVSTRHELEDFREGMDLKADHYISKPCTVEDIIKAIRLMATLIPSRI
jgi:DNA-binding response OmpR family regulator